MQADVEPGGICEPGRYLCRRMWNPAESVSPGGICMYAC